MSTLNPEEKAIECMVSLAKTTGVSGVAVFLIRPFKSNEAKEKGVIHYRIIDRSERSAESEDSLPDKGINDFSIALCAIAEMISTDLNSGEMDPILLRKGEFGHPGGCIFHRRIKNVIYYSAFSGGTAEQDIAIAKIGIQALLEEGHS